MADITITVNDNVAVSVRDALCVKWGYTGVNTNQAKMDFLKAFIAAYIKQEYKEQKGKEAGIAASNTAVATADTADIT